MVWDFGEIRISGDAVVLLSFGVASVQADISGNEAVGALVGAHVRLLMSPEMYQKKKNPKLRSQKLGLRSPAVPLTS